MREIFLEEAREVLHDAGVARWPSWRTRRPTWRS